MKSIIKLLSILLIASVFSGCETVDFGDTNVDNNGPTTYDTAALLTAAQTRFATNTGRQYRSVPSLYVQYQAQPVYQDESRYAGTPYGWNAYYVQTLSNLKIILDMAEDPEASTDPGFLLNGYPDNQKGVALILKNMIIKRVTDCYGDIPVSQSLDPTIQSPVYDSQENIYKNMIKELKSARDMLDVSELGPAGDIIYYGDLSKWKRLANSMLLAATLQLSKRIPTSSEYAALEFKAALSHSSGVIETVDQEAWFIHKNVSSFENPWSSFRAADYNLSKYFVDALQGDGIDFSSTTADKRLDVFSSNPSAEGVVYGLAAYTSGMTSGRARMSSTIKDAGAPQAFMTSSYTYLNRAEAAQLNWTSEDPSQMLEKAIIKSYESISSMYDVDITADAASFATARLADAAGGNIAQVIGEEKWVSLFPNGFEAWSEWRRTDFPKLTPSPAPLNKTGAIATRYPYPTSEITLNNANYKSGVENLTPPEDLNDSKVWWDN